jgi:hypothetical protein
MSANKNDHDYDCGKSFLTGNDGENDYENGWHRALYRGPKSENKCNIPYITHPIVIFKYKRKIAYLMSLIASILKLFRWADRLGRCLTRTWAKKPE